jgi:hypothetical protein
MKTVIFQFEYGYGDRERQVICRKPYDIQFVIQTCTESVKEYAEKHGYDYRFITEPHETSYAPKLWYKRDMTCEWIYWLNDLADEYDHIIVMDTDVLVVDDSEPFPINNTGYLCVNSMDKNRRHTLNGVNLKEHTQYFVNSGVVKLDKLTAKKLYNWFKHNRDDNYEYREDSGRLHVGDQVHILKYLIEHPEDFNPTLPRKFNVCPMPSNIFEEITNFDEPAYFWHLVTNKKADLLTFLFTNTEKYDRI